MTSEGTEEAPPAPLVSETPDAPKEGDGTDDQLSQPESLDVGGEESKVEEAAAPPVDGNLEDAAVATGTATSTSTEEASEAPTENSDEEDNDDDDEATNDNNNNNDDDDNAPTSGKGAQILMSRFNSLKERANQNAQSMWSKRAPTIQTNAKAVQETAQSFWRQAPKIPVPVAVTSLRTGFRQATPNEMTQDDNKTETNQGGETEVQAKQLSLDEPSTSETDAPPPANTTENGTGGPKVDVTEALAKASIAASVAYESVSTGFRGRYKDTPSGDDAEEPESKQDVVPTKPMPESQTEVILKSRVGQHMQKILDELEDHEYAMLVGRGMLGVNLKQCFLKSHGVYIDFLVPTGQAAISGVVRSGDLPIRLGEMDLRKATILEVPAHIAKAKRPEILVLSTGTKVSPDRMTYIDVVVAMMHRARENRLKNGVATSGVDGPSETLDPQTVQSVSEVEINPSHTIDHFLTPLLPSSDVKREFAEETAYRSLDGFVVEDLCEAQAMDTNFREAVRNAFLTCALDTRRLTFLSRFFSTEGDTGIPESTLGNGKMPPSAHLMLFLELTSFLNLYDVTPQDRIREVANRIAHKFFLPSQIGNNKLQPPLFDFHHIVPGPALRHLEFVLSGKSQNIPRDLFLDFSKEVVNSITKEPFLSFLASSECSRMRAYLRNTAPFINLPLHAILDGETGGTGKNYGAKNVFIYILLFLLCRTEKEASGEYMFESEKEANNRISGASDALCCAMYIRKTFVPTLNKGKQYLDDLKGDTEFEEARLTKLVETCEQLWDMFFENAEIPCNSNDVDLSSKRFKEELQNVAKQVLGVEGNHRKQAELILESSLVERALAYSNELVLHFGDSVFPKFREHKFHEWLCAELCKVRANDPNWNSDQQIPNLPQGSLKRLLRKAELPDGVSSHKPFRQSAPDAHSDTGSHSPEFGVVFGSSFGAEMAAQMPVPGIEASDVRRYTCLPIGLDQETDFDSFDEESVLPPTFESYAVVPARAPESFAEQVAGRMISDDGWEVSLVTFTIPSANSSPTDSGLHGVSLCLRPVRKGAPEGERRIESFVHDVEAHSGSKEGFQSPIRSSKIDPSPSDDLPVKGESKSSVATRVHVNAPLPVFNDSYKQASWISQVQTDEYHNSDEPITVGLALVSRKNVILSMRETLSRFLFDYTGQSTGPKGQLCPASCATLADVLGNFANREIEKTSLRCILEPYIRVATNPWIDRPLQNQADEYEKMAIRQVTDCLPPIPLALMCIAALLEQKIILSSSRRSILHAATATIRALLAPLDWSHLMVPMVPSSLAGDLIQYPAPYILGIPSEGVDSAELIGNLPRDVTLVDLDVGRVIVAPSFAYNNDVVQKAEDKDATLNALRSQVLHLAQALGTIFGNSLKPETWLCDVPFKLSTFDPPRPDEGISRLLGSSRAFVSELLAGMESSCYWIEEETKNYGSAAEPTVLFDEDRFFEIKSSRAKQGRRKLFAREDECEFSFDVSKFDLVLESFLRCQSVSTHISSRPKESMVYH